MELSPLERINKVAHLLPIHVLEDIRTRMGDWMLGGGELNDPYMHQQARYAENVAESIQEKMLVSK